MARLGIKKGGTTVGGFRRAFDPYSPIVPAGTYDPALDSQLGAAQRGYGNFQEDAATQTSRALTDFTLGQSDINQGYDRNLADLNQSRDRGLQDIGTSRTRGGEDYNRNIQLLQRSYQQLAGRQQEQQNAAGVLKGGAVLQAAAKRKANEALDRQPMDTNFARFGQDLAQQESRLNQDYGTQFGRLGEDKTAALNRLALGATRGQEDLGTQVKRAGVELGQYGLDIGQQKLYQSMQTGYVPPTKARNEFSGPQGPYRVVQEGDYNVRYDPSGRVISKTRRR